MMITFLLMIFVVPAWAGEQTASPSAITAEQSSIENALTKVTIEAEDWLDGNTYHIRYTFTNPADVQIDKQIKYMTVKYEPIYYAATSSKPALQYSEGIPHLIIPPHSTYTTTISLPQQKPAVFNNLTYSRFYFADHSYLDYAKPYLKPPKALFSISPLISPDGDAFFSVQNNSISKTITEISNIRLYFYHEGQCTISLLADSIPLNIKPNESQALDFFPSKAIIAKEGSSSKPFYPYSAPFYKISMNINGISHTYSEILDQSKLASKDTLAHPFDTKYESLAQNSFSSKGSFYLDNSYLHAYIPLANASDAPISAPLAQYMLIFDYFDQHALHQTALFDIRLPRDFSLAPHETKYFYFKAPLPPNFHHSIPIIHPPSLMAKHPRLQYLTLFPIEDLPLSVPQEDHTVITHVNAKKTNSFQQLIMDTII